MEGIYKRKQHMRKEREFRKCKKSIGEIWEKDECRSEKVRKDKDSGRKRFQEERFTREIYSEYVI